MLPRLLLLAFALILVSAAPAPSIDDLLRQAATAVAEKKWDVALKLYERAAERTTDPGLIAYNQAVVYYQKGDLREAQFHYRRALEDATGLRHAQALLGLGCAQLKQAGERDADLLVQAIAVFQLCREFAGTPEALRRDASHNLELARLLLAQARARSTEQSEPPPEGGNTRQPAAGQSGQDMQPGPGGEEGPEPDHPDPTPRMEPGSRPRESQRQPLPGQGKLPLLLDSAEPQQLAPEDVAAYLQREAARIRRERESFEGARFPPAQTFKDW